MEKREEIQEKLSGKREANYKAGLRHQGDDKGKLSLQKRIIDCKSQEEIKTLLIQEGIMGASWEHYNLYEGKS